ncbi:ComEA family DNA-binding protein [Corynebacterium afermentans subsp. lipophilum]|uniref:ComEA family DNA-binding protein n=1 Tax=Corynebacterium afermentans TaxID=38286 RepID=UPI00188AAC17|nr:ComEA family DNA-binding protein [Corynebacterium afermentans]MBF4547073.1 ComEA family DNA-binding protein [Corynebacterium afermentans subsp. lipophilum]WJY59435.1 ComE operon protein 1 [Corynebacterium afermentans subsp. lipophilum]
MNAIDRLQELTRPTGEEDLLAVRYPAPRVSVPVKPAAAAVVALLVVVGAWALLRGGGGSDEDVSWEQVASPTEVSGVVVVAVVGEVANPGLMTLNQGSRIADALQIAQPLPHADLLAHNQAQLLVDGQQIHVQAVGAAPPAGGGGAAAPDTGTVSLNNASASELTVLPGVGEATAAAIVAHREANGPFTAVEQLTDVRGIGPAKFEAMRDMVGL